MRRVLLGGLLACLAGCTPSQRSFTIHLPDGQPLFVRSIGRGPDTVVVLHHGPGLHGAYLVPMLEQLTQRRTFLVYDQRGRGRSNPALDTAQLTVTRDLADLDAVRMYFHLDQMTLLGHGWGGMLAAMYALDHPEHVKRLLLVSPMFPRAFHFWGVVMFPYESPDSLALAGLDSARISGLDRRDPEAFCRRYWGAWLSPAAVRDRTTMRPLAGPMCDAPVAALARVESVNRTLMRSMGNWDLRPRLHDLAMPTLLIQGMGTGTNDSSAVLVWRAATREWTEAMPHSGVVFLHAPAQFPWVGEGDAFDRAAAIFLAGEWPANARAPRSRITAK